MTTAAQKERLTGLFHFFDADGSGALTQSDFEIGGVRYAEALKQPKGSPVYVAYTENFMKMWGIIKALDTNKDNKVTKEEFFNGLGHWMKDDKEHGLANLLASWTDIIFKAFESEHRKGSLNPKEFQTIAIIADDKESKKLFDQIDKDKNGFVSEKEFKDFCHSYFFDPSSTYNCNCFFYCCQKVNSLNHF